MRCIGTRFATEMLRETFLDTQINVQTTRGVDVNRCIVQLYQISQES